MDKDNNQKDASKAFWFRLAIVAVMGLPVIESNLWTDRLAASVYPVVIVACVKAVMLVVACEGYPIRHLLVGSVVGGLSVWGFWYNPMLIGSASAALICYVPMVLGFVWARSALRAGNPKRTQDRGTSPR